MQLVKLGDIIVHNRQIVIIPQSYLLLDWWYEKLPDLVHKNTGHPVKFEF